MLQPGTSKRRARFAGVTPWCYVLIFAQCVRSARRLLGHQYRVDDVDQPVGRRDVCLGDVGLTVELDATLRADLEVATIQRGCGIAVKLHHVGRPDLGSLANASSVGQNW